MRKKIIGFAVLACLLLMSIQTVLAVSTTDIYGPFIGVGAPAAPSQFVADFFHMEEASVTLTGDTYTFEMTMNASSMPSDWMTSTWHPTFSPPHGNMPITWVDYRWLLFDDSERFLGFIHLIWSAEYPQWQPMAEAIICGQGVAAYNGCIHSVGHGVGVMPPSSTFIPLPPFGYSLDPKHSSVSLTISKSELENININLFGTSPAKWMAVSAVYFIGHAMAAESGVGYVTWPLLDLPTQT